MREVKLDVSGTDQYVADQLRTHLRSIEPNRFTTWRWWSGFLWGVAFMAVMNIGDVHVCVGECDSEGVAIFGNDQ